MRKSCVCLFVISLLFLSNARGAEEAKTGPGAGTEGKLIYPQVGFWEIVIKVDGTEKGYTASGEKARQLLSSTEKGKEYYESYIFRNFLGLGLFGGGLLTVGVNNYFWDKNNDPNNPASSLGFATVAIAGAGLMVAGLFISAYAPDDLFLSINEYNRQVKGNQSWKGTSFILAKNCRF